MARRTSQIDSRPAALVALLLLALLVPRAAAAGFRATLEVDTTANGTNWFDGKCSLREAIANVNSNGAGGMVAGECEAGDGSISNKIVFDPGVFGSGATIALTLGSGDLPAITRSFTTLDGWSAGGDGYTGPPLVTIDGSGLVASTGSVIGLELAAAGITVRGLVVTGFATDSGSGTGIYVRALDCSVQGSYIGLAADGTTPAPNELGLFVSESSAGSLVGTDGDGSNDAAEGNVIVDGIAARQGTIAGNRIGTDASGLVAVTTALTGVSIQPFGDVTLGGPTPVERNVISGHAQHGVRTQPSEVGVGRILILGNYIGTDSSGNAPLPNGVGIAVTKRLGTGTVSAYRIEGNVVSGNSSAGVEVLDQETRIAGNTIGLGVDGSTAVGNDVGIRLLNSPGNLVTGNLISGNTTAGVIVEEEESIGNTIVSNWIGPTAAAAATPLLQPVGIELLGCSQNSIVDNLVAGNLTQISLSERNLQDVFENRIVHNRIGSGPDGVYLGSQAVGISLESGISNLVADNDIRFCERGIVVDGAGLGERIFRNLLTLNDGFAALELSGFPVLLPDSTGNCIEANTSVDDDVSNLSGTSVLFEDNWWGAASGPSGIGPGTGETVSADVDFEPWLTSRPLCGFAGDGFADGFESGDPTAWSSSSP